MSIDSRITDPRFRQLPFRFYNGIWAPAIMEENNDRSQPLCLRRASPRQVRPVALACGNTFVPKPSERDPSAPLFIAELLTQAGLPKGVFNVVNGDKEAVDALLTHPDVKAVSFVGSDADRPLHLCHGDSQRKACAGAGRRQEPCHHHAGRRSRHGGRRPDGGGLRLCRRALHGDLGGGSGRRADGEPGCEAQDDAQCRSRYLPRPFRSPHLGQTGPQCIRNDDFVRGLVRKIACIVLVDVGQLDLAGRIPVGGMAVVTIEVSGTKSEDDSIEVDLRDFVPTIIKGKTIIAACNAARTTARKIPILCLANMFNKLCPSP